MRVEVTRWRGEGTWEDAQGTWWEVEVTRSGLEVALHRLEVVRNEHRAAEWAGEVALGLGDVGISEFRSARYAGRWCPRHAAEGKRFTDAHTPASVCSPTRYALLTGRYA